MITNRKIIFGEFGLGILLAIACQMSTQLQLPVKDAVASINANCFELNSAMTIAFLVALISGEAFTFKGRNMKAIARNSTVLFLANSFIMGLYPLAGLYAPALVLATLGGNIIKFYSVSRNILMVI